MELRSLKPYQPPTAMQRMHIHGLQDSAAHFALAEIFSRRSNARLVITKDLEQAESLAGDLLFYKNHFATGNIHLTQPLLFPGWEISPYKKISPSSSTRHQRLHTLGHCLHQPQQSLIIASLSALSQICANRDFFHTNTFSLQAGQNIDPQFLERRLMELGYQRLDPVEDIGSFAKRGGIIDVFSPAHPWPIRIDFFGDTIETIRPYNPTTQRSLTEIQMPAFQIIPAREFACDPAELALGRGRIKEWADTNDIPRSQRDRIGDLLAKGILSQELDFLLPFLQNAPGHLFDYLPANTEIYWLEQSAALNAHSDFIEKQTELFSAALSRQEVIAPAEKLFLPPAELQSVSGKYSQTLLTSLAWHGGEKEKSLTIIQEKNPKLLEHSKENVKGKRSVNLDQISQHLQELFLEKYHVYFVANSQAQLDRFAFLLAQRNISTQIFSTAANADPTNVFLLLGSISSGFRLPEEKIVFLSEDEIFGQKTHLRRQSQSVAERALSATTLDHLQITDLVVHKDHGIGRYRGLVKLAAAGVANDFVFIEYAGADKLYLPVYRLENIQKYVGAGGSNSNIALDKLGSQQFAKLKDKVKAAVKDIAANLLRLYAERATRESYAFSEPDELFREFESSFPFDETPDQLKAIQDTLIDMCRPKPMDRLICGDVGFGKTEVAIRAAFKACQDNKQVAVLVPTTILAEQHYQTFQKRMADHGVKVGCLSRFRSKAEQKQILIDLAEGKLDIVIGTHRLLSKDVKMKDLGLLIIDEEQRFGVEHKEKLKQFKATTDILTLTATPIPRTLHLSLMGMRDISIITTPPMDRLSIRTHLAPFDLELIRSAVSAELARGGQVYFIHNRVQSIPTLFRQLQEILPEAKISVGHGQMPEGELEKVMHDFYHGESDILLATTIIENGLDIANANTIIVNRADTFGLAQLYQIRGRVGRSQVRAQAYFLVPEDRDITDDAKERLQILQRFVELGSGFAVASHDLEMRGGGDILGDSQSGHIADVGYDLYLELLEEEVLRLKGETVEREEEVEISSPFPAFLPEAYVPDMRSRLSLYKALSDLSSEESIDKAEQELRDRYGTIPPETVELLFLLKIKVLLRRLGFRSFTVSTTAISLQAGKAPKVDPEKLLQLIRTQPKRYTLTPEQKFIMRGNYSSLHASYDDLRQTVSTILHAKA